ncbi:MAG: hypothetical protein NDF54_11195 [archaeon GB-1867-035]|nr:hypothetical protein [Candidatus Culexmicrobium profundum]
MSNIQLLIENVKNWHNFLNEFEKFANSQEFLEAVDGKKVTLKRRFHGTIMVEVEGVVSVGDFENWNILCDGQRIGFMEVCYMDQHFFVLSVEVIDALLSDDELKTLMLSGSTWATPLKPIKISINARNKEKLRNILIDFISNYTDDYPNPIAKKFAPKARVL